MPEQAAIVDDFLSRAESEAPKLTKALEKLGDEARPQLSAILGCFDLERRGTLGENGTALALRVLSKLHRPSTRGLELLGRALVFLDADGSRALEHQEAVLAVEILELFCKADSVNDTLSVRELEMLLAVLEDLDRDGNGRLDPDERSRLRDELWEPDAFLAAQKEHNAKLRELLG